MIFLIVPLKHSDSTMNKGVVLYTMILVYTKFGMVSFPHSDTLCSNERHRRP